MIKKALYVSVALMLCLHSFSQVVGKYTFKGKEYLVFPYRIANAGDIPMLGYDIPDGEYLAFSTYNFKAKLSFKREKKYVLTDTTMVAALFTIKANQAEGPAVFYDYSYGNRGKQHHKPSEETSGNFAHGLKNGEWKKVEKGHLAEIKTYKDGVPDGYLFRYGDGGLRTKEKFCGGKLCDTVFYYTNGRLWKEYDLCPPGAYQVSNYYSRMLVRLGIRFTKAKTYYKEYDRTGKAIVDIKLKAGEVLPFDSMQSVFRGIGTTHNYVVIKKINDRQLLGEFHDFGKYARSVTKEYYEGDFMFKRSVIYYTNITKRKWFLGKRKVVGIDTTISEEMQVDTKTMPDTGLCPVLIYKKTEERYTYKKYYIPRYRFTFYESDKKPVFIKVDTLLGRIYLNRYRSDFYSKYNLSYEQISFSAERQMQLDGQNRPFLRKEFIVPDVMDYVEDESKSIELRMNRYRTQDFTSIDTKKTYRKDSVLLNGLYCFSSVRKPKHAPKHITYTGPTNLEENIHLGAFVNGVKEGQWLGLRQSYRPKRVPQDFKAWFFAHPKKADDYTEENYKQGMLDGLCVYYEKYDPKKRDYRSKEPIVLYRSKELHYVRDTLNGNCKVYYPSGKVMREMNMLMGSPDGELKTYFEDGKLARSVQFKKGKLDGPCLEYKPNGLYSYAFFKDNCVKDSVIYYGFNDKPSMAIYTRDDTLVKKVTYYQDGKPKEVVTFDRNSRAVIVKEVLSSESFIEVLRTAGNNIFDEANGYYKNYYDNGQLLSEGPVKKGKLNGAWKFYSLNGVMVHDVDFMDTTINLPGREDPVTIAGVYKGYYINGKKRCTGYIKQLDLSYDCFTKQDKADLDFYVVDFYDNQGKQTLNNGKGYFIKYDENGSKLCAGKLKGCAEDSLWRYYTPEQKLKEIGHYVNEEKEGVWYKGSLEGINFEDGACFDMNDPEAVKDFNARRKELNIVKTIYRNGVSIESSEFYSDLNKNYDPQKYPRELEY